MFCWSCECCPIIHILVIVKIFTPLNKSINVLLELLIINLFKFYIIKGVFIESLKLFLELNWFNSSWIQTFTLFLYYFCIFCISVKFAQPFNFLCPFLCCRFLCSHSSWIMKRFRFASWLHVNLVNLCEHFIIYWTPSIIFESHIPAVMFIVFWFIKMNID